MRAGAGSVIVWTLPLAILAAACVVIATDPMAIATRIRGIEFDAYQQTKPRPYQDAATRSGHAVRILDIDADGIARFGPWPWSRTVLARLAIELKAAGASLVVFDMPLDGPDPSSPNRVMDALPQTPDGANLRAELAALPSPDAIFAESLAKVPSVTGFTLGEEGREPQLKYGLQFSGADEPLRVVPDFGDAAAALAPIEATSAGVGARNLPFDSEGELRSVPLVLRLNGRPVPTLDAEVVRLITGTPLEISRAEEGLSGFNARVVVTGANAGPYAVALGPEGGLDVYYSGFRPERLVSAAALDQGQYSAGALKGAVVYIAPPDATVRTPIGLCSRGEVRAETLENILLGAELKPASAPQASFAFLAIVGAGLVFLLARGKMLWASAVAIGAIVAVQALAWSLFSQAQILLDAATPTVGLTAALIAGLGARGLEVARARGRLRASFADSLPEKAIAAIASKPSLLKLNGESRTVTCLSCGIRGFAAIAESFAEDPPGFTRLINMAIAPLIENAIGHGGMIGRFDGEGFLACWNAPLDDPEHAIHACEVANRMTVTLAEVNEQLARERRLDGTAYEPIEIGIGISTGQAIAGGFSAHGRTLYTVTGDATVTADRIRDLSATYGPAVIVGEAARKSAQRGFAFLEVDFIAAGPKDKPVKLYAMLGNPLVRASPKFRAMETFHEHIFESLRLQQWEKARGLIEQCRKLSGASQKMYDLHLARVAYFEANPPGPEWDGAFRPILK